MDLNNMIMSIDGFISPDMVWLVFLIITLLGLLAIFVLRYHWNKYLFGGEFLQFRLIKGVFIGTLGVLWVILFIITVTLTVKF